MRGRVIAPGDVFDRLTVVGKAAKIANERCRRWLCRCACGIEKTVSTSNLGRNTRSCGCLSRDIARGRATHGATRNRQFTPEFNVWVRMKQRCTNPSNDVWRHYGGRGITVCERWAESFEAFFSDMGLRPSPAHSIDRIDNSLGYGPGNCRWATMFEQSRNRRTNRILTIHGESLTLEDWAARAGRHKGTIWNRLKLGWDPEAAVFSPGSVRHQGSRPGRVRRDA